MESETLIGVLPSTYLITSANPAKLFSLPILRFARLCVSDVDMTRLNSSALDSKARSAPRRFGTNTVYSTPGTRLIRPITSSASLSIGIDFGEVNEVTSILAKPQSLSSLTNLTLSSVGIKFGSI